jgi:hypothetical protein
VEAVSPHLQEVFMSLIRHPARAALAALLLGLFAASAVPVSAQFDPPSTIYGSVTDAAGDVPEGLAVEAYIGEVLCGTRGRTEFTGDGAARVTVYAVNVVSASQVAGCGVDGARVRIKIGERFASGTAGWQMGPVQFDVTFGGATPAPIPTFTPLPTRTPEPASTPTPPANGGTPANNQTPGAVETIPPGSPGAGSPVTRPGGVTSSDPNAPESGSSNGGFPVWGVVVLLLGGIAAIGGGVGIVMARNRNDDRLAEADLFDDRYDPPPSDDLER